MHLIMDYLNKKVTIIIPVYKDWDTLKLCIESLKKHVNSRHQIFLVNDMSPEWETMEHHIKKIIEGCTQFHYFRNTENMGFVKTCNFAVQELDKTDNRRFFRGNVICFIRCRETWCCLSTKQ